MTEISMNQKKELKKIARQAFPLSKYSFFEGRNYRKNLYNEMSAYLYNHPESSSEDIRDLFCGEGGNDDEPTDAGISKKAKACFIILGLLIIIICVTFLFISSSWDAPIFTTN